MANNLNLMMLQWQRQIFLHGPYHEALLGWESPRATYQPANSRVDECLSSV